MSVRNEIWLRQIKLYIFTRKKSRFSLFPNERTVIAEKKFVFWLCVYEIQSQYRSSKCNEIYDFCGIELYEMRVEE